MMPMLAKAPIRSTWPTIDRHSAEGIWDTWGSHAPVFRRSNSLHDERNSRGCDDADEQATANVAHNQPATDDQANDEDECWPGCNGTALAQSDWNGGHCSVWNAGDKATINKADHGDEQANTHTDGSLERHWNRVKDCAAETGDGQDDNDDALDDHQAHCLWPGQTLTSNESDSNKRVDTQSGRECERIVGQYTEENCDHAGYQCSCCCDLGNAKGGSVDVFYCADNQRVQQDNVCHGEERHRSRDGFSSNAGTTF